MKNREEIKKVVGELEAAIALLKEEIGDEDTVERKLIPTVRVGNLEWMADVPDQEFTWQEAKDYAASLGDGWRLPTIQELLTLVDYTKHNPACSVFPDTPCEWFWSSSAYAGNTLYAWDVNFRNGHTNYSVVGYHNRVRCVRDVAVQP